MKKEHLTTGEKKDSVIEEVLTRYTSGFNAPPNAVYPAVRELRRIRARRKTLIQVFAAAAAAVFVMFGIYTIGKNLMDPTPPAVYSAASLKRGNSDILRAESIDGLMIIKSAGEVAAVKELKDKNGAVYVVAIEYLFLGEGGTEKLLVVADIKNGLTDFISYKKYPGNTLKQKTEYDNGEYYSYGYFESGGIQYYMILMSPIKTDLSEYVGMMS